MREQNQYHVVARLSDGSVSVLTVNNVPGDDEAAQIEAARARVAGDGHEVLSVETDHAVAAQKAESQEPTKPQAKPTPAPPSITRVPAPSAE